MELGALDDLHDPGLDTDVQPVTDPAPQEANMHQWAPAPAASGRWVNRPPCLRNTRLTRPARTAMEMDRHDGSIKAKLPEVLVKSW